LPQQPHLSKFFESVTQIKGSGYLNQKSNFQIVIVPLSIKGCQLISQPSILSKKHSPKISEPQVTLFVSFAL